MKQTFQASLKETRVKNQRNHHLEPGSVIVFRRAPPLQYTPTWPSGTWCRIDKVLLKDVGAEGTKSCR